MVYRNSVLAERVTVWTMPYPATCIKGGFSVLRHNNVRDTEAEILREVCKDVTIKPPLIPSDKLGDRSKIPPRGIILLKQEGGGCVHCTSNMKTRRRTSTSDMCLRRRNATSLPLVFSTHGGCAPEADKFHKQVATLLAKKEIFSKAKLSRM